MSSVFKHPGDGKEAGFSISDQFPKVILGYVMFQSQRKLVEEAPVWTRGPGVLSSACPVLSQGWLLPLVLWLSFGSLPVWGLCHVAAAVGLQLSSSCMALGLQCFWGLQMAWVLPVYAFISLSPCRFNFEAKAFLCLSAIVFFLFKHIYLCSKWQVTI